MTVSSTCGKTLAVELRFVDQAGNTLATNYYYPYGGNCAQGDPGALSNLTTKRFTACPEPVEGGNTTKVACPAARG